MSDIFNIQNLRNKLDSIELDSIFEQEIAATGIFEDWDDLEEGPTARQRKRFVGPKEPGGSPLINAFGKDTAGVKLAKHLHDKFQVSDRARLEPFEHPSGNLDLMTFKTHYDNFTILKGPGGWAAIKPKTEYLRPRLDANNPNYNPSKDRDIVYIGVFSLYNGSDVFVKEITGTRGGAYSKREKKEVTTPTIADQLKDMGIGDKGIKVYRLMDRDEPAMSQVPPEKFSGRRSRDIGVRGASVQRAKSDARANLQKSMNPDTTVLAQRVADRLFRVAPNVIGVLPRRLRRQGIDADTNTKYQNISNNPSSPAFKQVWTDAVERSFPSIISDPGVQAAIQDFRTNNPQNTDSDGNVVVRIASMGKPEVLQPLLRAIRDNLEQWVKS